MASTSTRRASEGALFACLNLMRRLLPHRQKENLAGLLTLMPDEELAEELLQHVEQPLEEALDPETGRKYLLCDYNRDGNSYRSPWSNKYFPPLPAEEEATASAFYPSDWLRSMEAEANELFDIYRELYYEGGGTSSFYMWDIDHPGHPGSFAGCFAIKKEVNASRALKQGTWDSIHILEVLPSSGGNTATYKLTSTILLTMTVENETVGDMNLSGNMTRQLEANHPLEGNKLGGQANFQQQQQQSHLANMGRMIEDMELQLRSDLDALYVQRTREIVNSIRGLRAEPLPTTTSTAQTPPSKFALPGLGARRLSNNNSMHAQSLLAAIAKRQEQAKNDEIISEG